MLEAHAPPPSLVHGDLWGGNAGATALGEPVIFDPATYYGDREVDLAMTTLFDKQPDAFYAAYDEAYPRPAGWKQRETVYNLYHILNHDVLFGGGYLSSAHRMCEQIMAF